MNRRVGTTVVITVSVVGLCGVATATAWADTFTPGVEEPTADVGLPGGGNDLVGSAPMGEGNHSSAVGRNGGTYADSYSGGISSYRNSVDDHSDQGYWRDSGGDGY